MTQLWVLQSNMQEDHYLQQRAMIEACQGLSLQWSSIPVLPYEKTLRRANWDGPSVYYGSTKMVRLASQDHSTQDPIFYNETTFKPSVWGAALGEQWLNHGSTFMTVGEFLDDLKSIEHFDLTVPDRPPEIFIRPDADLKTFTGQVLDYRAAPNRLAHVPLDTPMLLNMTREILFETRCWMVEGKVIAAVTYREFSKRSIKPHLVIPEVLSNYAEEAAKLITPAGVFVMDIAGTHKGLRVIEINSFHASGFYSTEMVLPVVRDVSNYVAQYY